MRKALRKAVSWLCDDPHNFTNIGLSGRRENQWGQKRGKRREEKIKKMILHINEKNASSGKGRQGAMTG
jgi:hypothetical protein